MDIVYYPKLFYIMRIHYLADWSVKYAGYILGEGGGSYPDLSDISRLTSDELDNLTSDSFW